MLRRPRLFATTAVALLFGPLLSPAPAAQYNSAPTHQNAGGGAVGFGGSAAGVTLIGQSHLHSGGKPSSPPSNNAYTVSTALSTALSIGGTADVASAPAVQTAVGTAVSIGGNASAAASNTDDVSRGSAP